MKVSASNAECAFTFGILLWKNHTQVATVIHSNCVLGITQSQGSRPLCVLPVEIGHKHRKGAWGTPTHSSDFSTNVLRGFPDLFKVESVYLTALSLEDYNCRYCLWNICLWSPHLLPRGKDRRQFLFLTIFLVSWHIKGAQRYLLNEWTNE